MENVRKSAVAGSFYPGNPDKLSRMVEEFLADSEKTDITPKALIVPHAGYMYSGAVAGQVFGLLMNSPQRFTRIVLFGPAHRYPFSGLALSSAKYFETPLGRVTTYDESVEEIIDLPYVQILDEAHREEHSLEVQLPFLQKILKDFVVIPIVVGKARAEEIAKVMEILDTPDSLILVSSDLSHFLTYDEARRIDQQTCLSIEQLALEELDDFQACGARPIRGLLQYAQQKGLKAKTVALMNSGDITGERDRVVGYGGYLFH